MQVHGNGSGTRFGEIGSFTNPQIRETFNSPEIRAKVLGEKRLQTIIAMLLAELGLDIKSEHFQDTPTRVARFYREFTRGYRVNPAGILKTFASRNREMVVLSDVEFFSLCPHHLLIYGGKIHFSYVPGGRIVGISKIPRLIQALAARAVVQEELVADIADAFVSVVKPLGCAVMAIGKHDCVAARGVRCPKATMTTVAMRGIFSDDQNYALKFHQCVACSGECVR